MYKGCSKILMSRGEVQCSLLLIKMPQSCQGSREPSRLGRIGGDPPGCARSGVDFFGHHAGPSTERVPQPSSLLRGTAGVAEGNRGLPEWPNRPVYQGEQQESRRVTEAFPSGPRPTWLRDRPVGKDVVRGRRHHEGGLDLRPW